MGGDGVVYAGAGGEDEEEEEDEEEDDDDDDNEDDDASDDEATLLHKIITYEKWNQDTLKNLLKHSRAIFLRFLEKNIGFSF